MLPILNLPVYNHRIKNIGQSTQIFDSIRRKFVALTPEEWVRQHFIHFLINEKKFPPSLLAVEKELKLNRMKRRTDIVVYNKSFNPLLIVECKSPEIRISQKVFDQAARYNLVLNVSYLAVTNGLENIYCTMDHEKRSYNFMKDIPAFGDISS